MQLTIDIAGIAALILAAVALFKAIRVTPHEETATDAEAVVKFANAAGVTVDQMIAALKREDETNKALGIMRTDIEALRNEAKKREALIEEWQMGIEILIKQLKRNNLDPEWTPQNGRVASKQV